MKSGRIFNNLNRKTAITIIVTRPKLDLAAFIAEWVSKSTQMNHSFHSSNIINKLIMIWGPHRSTPIYTPSRFYKSDRRISFINNFFRRHSTRQWALRGSHRHGDFIEIKQLFSVSQTKQSCKCYDQTKHQTVTRSPWLFYGIHILCTERMIFE